ncbi:helix-turn-helix domain-containing protein [Lactiplantibacillus plantarum]|uniref:winged helix-turn-helix domain-containing protein n=1 Tax=Lactiplantibacillus plantarum TaxID=1590 RepID=UPI0018A01298|nr:helix-turn-helix domain-containing protein [Lactiplantibacillus plantarum]MDB7776433.1 helix-turn-helix domain-containing protein [Lactiplantibacillus plantarum]MDB7785410.1 helix-turn-helix domain-containing protein [Lactiplantibacillus plantarum]MDB7788471.1 helix-turn-helix domain-containing protein [Lactiplantibacillus plantarum]
MPKNTLAQFAKLMVDPKVAAILKATKSKTGLTTKQISAQTKIPNNQLYYTINKMQDADLLTIVNQVQVKNLTENYYSSAHLSHETPQELADLDGLDTDLTDVSGTWTQAHVQQVLQWIMLLNHDFTEAYQEEMTRKQPDKSAIFFSNAILNLSAAGEHQLRLDLIKLLGDAEKNDPDPQSTDKRQVKLLIEKWQ